jgi:hypothetical protein
MNGMGYIYVASNVSMPGLLKIGATNSSPSERLPELQSTGVPTPFILEACIRVVSAVEAEQRIHALLLKWRPTSNREFFQISVNDCLTQILPSLAKFLTANSNAMEAIKPRVPKEEEQVLLFILNQTQKRRRPSRSDIQNQFQFSKIKTDYVFGSLLKKKFIRDITEDRESHSYQHGSYKVKVVKLEHAGIQYLLDNHLIAQTDL